MSKKVFQFEKLFAKYVGTKYAGAVNSGTSALEISLRALNVEGKSVIIPTNTFMVTPLAAIHAGAKVIFADISEKTLSIQAEEIEKKIRKDTVGIILVHIGGIISHEWKKINFLVKKGFNEKLGARPLARVIDEEIKKPLSKMILFGELTSGGMVEVSLTDDVVPKLKINFKASQTVTPAKSEKEHAKAPQ